MGMREPGTISAMARKAPLPPLVRRLLADDAIAVAVPHVPVGRVAPRHRRYAMAPGLGAGDSAVAVVGVPGERVGSAGVARRPAPGRHCRNRNGGARQICETALRRRLRHVAPRNPRSGR